MIELASRCMDLLTRLCYGLAMTSGGAPGRAPERPQEANEDDEDDG